MSDIFNNGRDDRLENILAKKLVAPGGPISETDLSPLYKGVQASPEPTAAEVLKPICPNPDAGFESLSVFQVTRITKRVMKRMRKPANRCQAPK